MSTSDSDETLSISDTDSDPESEPNDAPAHIDLTLERLQSLQAMGTVSKKDLTEYAKKGLSATRIKLAVLNPRCSCMCRMPIKLLFHICVAFWQLTKRSQDALLWSIQHESGTQKKKQWHIAGQLT